MYDSLKKHGLSDTKRELKFHLGNCSAGYPYNHSSKQSQKATPVKVSNFELPSEPSICPQTTVLDKLINVLLSKRSQTCQIKGHDHNQMRFICLEQSCPEEQKVGCSYCFLEHHQTHHKMQTNTCLRELCQLKKIVKNNRQEIRKNLAEKRQYLFKKIDLQIKMIKEDFEKQLIYFQSKIQDAIERQFKAKLEQLETKAMSPEAIQFDEGNMTFIEQLSEKQSKDLSIDDIFDIFSSKKTGIVGSSKKQYSSNYKSIQKQQQQSSYSSKLTQQEEKNLLSKLSRLNSKQVQEYLKQQYVEFQECLQYLRVYEEFYKEMRTSLGQFFGTFKTALPGYKSMERSNLQPPQILRVC